MAEVKQVRRRYRPWTLILALISTARNLSLSPGPADTRPKSWAAGYIVRRGNGEGRGSRIRPAFKMAGSS